MDTLRDELSSAFDEDTSNAAEEETETQTGEEASTTDLSSDIQSAAEDQSSTETDGSNDSGEEAKADSGEAEGDGADDGVAAKETKEAEEDIKAPIDYDPETKELWKDVPTKVKQHIQKREHQIAQAMQGTNEARRTHQNLSKLASDFAPILAAEGVSDPMEAVTGLFKTVAEIRMGSPQQRANKMAQLIGHYGVDISMLDQALAGTAQTPETSQFETMLNQRLAPMQQQLQHYQNNERQQVAQSQGAVNQELAEFSKGAEFLQYVRNDMADLIDIASKRGQHMGFKEAYDKTCAMNPQISKVLADRTAAQSLQNSGKSLAGKKNASASIPGNSNKPEGATVPDNLRAQLNAAWEGAS